MGVGGCERVRACVGGCDRVQAGVHGYACVWDEFSEFLPKNRVPTSAEFNTYPIRIFFYSWLEIEWKNGKKKNNIGRFYYRIVQHLYALLVLIYLKWSPHQ